MERRLMTQEEYLEKLRDKDSYIHKHAKMTESAWSRYYARKLMKATLKKIGLTVYDNLRNPRKRKRISKELKSFSDSVKPFVGLK